MMVAPPPPRGAVVANVGVDQALISPRRAILIPVATVAEVVAAGGLAAGGVALRRPQVAAPPTPPAPAGSDLALLNLKGAAVLTAPPAQRTPTVTAKEEVMAVVRRVAPRLPHFPSAVVGLQA